MRLRISKLFFSLMVFAGTLSVPAFAINLQPGFDTGPLAASQVTPSCQNWTKNLSCADNNQQAVDNVVDQLSTGGSVSLPSGQIGYGTGSGITSSSSLTYNGVTLNLHSGFMSLNDSFTQLGTVLLAWTANDTYGLLVTGEGVVIAGENTLNDGSGNVNLAGGAFVISPPYGTESPIITTTYNGLDGGDGSFYVGGGPYSKGAGYAQFNIPSFAYGPFGGYSSYNGLVVINGNNQYNNPVFQVIGTVEDGTTGPVLQIWSNWEFGPQPLIQMQGLPTSDPSDGKASLWVDSSNYLRVGT